VVRDGVLRAQSFDPAKLTLKEDSTSVAPVQGFAWNSAAMYAPSANGLLAFQPQGNIDLSQLMRKTRDGKTLFSTEPAYYWSPRLSHDGAKIAVDVSNLATGEGDIWIYGARGEGGTRLTFEAANETAPLWSTDDSSITYMLNHSRVAGTPMNKRLAGGAASPLLPEASSTRAATDWSSDGSLLALVVFDDAGSGGRDVAVYSAKDARVTNVAATTADEAAAQFCPDGKWIAYQSNETGRDEIYVQPYPPTGAKYQVSTQGGRMPRWRIPGEIVYVAADGSITAVAVDTAATFRSAAPQSLFHSDLRDGGFFAQYDVAADGTIVVNDIVPHQPAPLTLFVNWTARLNGTTGH
jgi:eukaryotic-like serine/threonine-protein kinase